jgi:hypothetical protein
LEIYNDASPAGFEWCDARASEIRRSPRTKTAAVTKYSPLKITNATVKAVAFVF